MDRIPVAYDFTKCGQVIFTSFCFFYGLFYGFVIFAIGDESYLLFDFVSWFRMRQNAE